MHDRYNLSMSRQQQQLLMAWDKKFPPNQWERTRDERIAKVMGHHNPFVTGQKQWSLNHKNGGEGVRFSPPSTASIPKQPEKQTNLVKLTEIKGNKNSKKYHFSHCSGFKTLSDKNAVAFANENAAQEAGYQLAGNCKPR